MEGTHHLSINQPESLIALDTAGQSGHTCHLALSEEACFKTAVQE